MSTTTHNSHGTVLVDGVASFPIALSPPPPRGAESPAGADALGEVVAAGITFLRVGPRRGHWTDDALVAAGDWNDAAAAEGIHTWIALGELAHAQPDTAVPTGRGACLCGCGGAEHDGHSGHLPDVRWPSRAEPARPPVVSRSQPRRAFLALVSAVSHALAEVTLPCSTLVSVLSSSVPTVASSIPM